MFFISLVNNDFEITPFSANHGVSVHELFPVFLGRISRKMKLMLSYSFQKRKKKETEAWMKV